MVEDIQKLRRRLERVETETKSLHFRLSRALTGELNFNEFWNPKVDHVIEGGEIDFRIREDVKIMTALGEKTLAQFINADYLLLGNLDVAEVTISTDPGGGGARIEMDANGIKGYNSGGTNTVHINSADGKIWSNLGAFGGSGAGSATVTLDSGGLVVSGNAGIEVSSGTISCGDVLISSDKIEIGTSNKITLDASIASAPVISVGANISLKGSGSQIDAGNLTIYGVTSRIQSDSTHYIDFTGAADWLHFSSNFYVNSSGYLHAGGGGQIAGWGIDSTDIKKVTTGYGIQLESDTRKIIVGEIAGTNSIVIEGSASDATYIQSGNFNAGPTGAAGFRLDGQTGSLECIDGTFWGTLKSVIFETAEINIVNGDLILSDATKLAEDLDISETGVDVDDGTVFSANDLLMVGTSSEVMSVTSIAGNTLTVVRGARTDHGAATHNKQEVIYKVGVANSTYDWLELLGSTAAINGKHSSDNGTAITFSTAIQFDSINQLMAINDSTFGNDGIQLDYNSGNPQAYIGDGANQFVKFDGTNLSWKGMNTELTTGGILYADNIRADSVIYINYGQAGANSIL